MFRRRADRKRAWIAARTGLDRLGRRDIDTLSATADRVRVESGRVLARRGELGREAFLIVDGEVEVRRDGELLARLGPGEIVGELALLGDWHRTADVVATAPTELAVFGLRDFERALAGSPTFRGHVQASAATRTAA